MDLYVQTPLRNLRSIGSLQLSLPRLNLWEKCVLGSAQGHVSMHSRHRLGYPHRDYHTGLCVRDMAHILACSGKAWTCFLCVILETMQSPFAKESGQVMYVCVCCRLGLQPCRHCPCERGVPQCLDADVAVPEEVAATTSHARCWQPASLAVVS